MMVSINGWRYEDVGLGTFGHHAVVLWWNPLSKVLHAHTAMESRGLFATIGVPNAMILSRDGYQFESSRSSAFRMWAAEGEARAAAHVYSYPTTTEPIRDAAAVSIALASGHRCVGGCPYH